ncbi:MAG: putative lipid II flippase FtsW [Oscillospiraceae bacterium]|nr:putative lipid II flippase FtsW [Oscillospiraceae bacterium]
MEHPNIKMNKRRKTVSSTQRTPSRSTPDYTRNARYPTTTGKSSKASLGLVGTGGVAVEEPHIKMRERPPRWTPRAKFDIPFAAIVIALLVVGLAMMFSSSYEFGRNEQGNPYFYIERQLTYVAIGIVLMLVFSYIDYHILQKKGVLVVGCSVAIALMLAVKLWGTSQGGAERWLQIGTVTFQPSEMLKVAVIVVFAYFGEKFYKNRAKFKHGFLPFVIFLAVSCGLTIIQPHLSGTIIIFLIGITMMYVSGCRKRYLFVFLGAFVFCAIIGVLLLQAAGYTYFETRFLSWQDPEYDIRGETYQTYQSLIAMGSGGWFGLGIGDSRQKYSYLPAGHNDFIFSITTEELGFIGAFIIILLFIMLVFRGFYIARRSRDKFGMLLATGISAKIGIQALLNIGVASNAIPNTGVSLPFFSYGGTAIIVQLIQIGIILNISRKAAIE